MRDEHHTALANQAREIRLAARTLEEIASKDHLLDDPHCLQRIVISRKLGEIKTLLHALLARFGS